MLCQTYFAAIGLMGYVNLVMVRIIIKGCYSCPYVLMLFQQADPDMGFRIKILLSDTNPGGAVCIIQCYPCSLQDKAFILCITNIIFGMRIAQVIIMKAECFHTEIIKEISVNCKGRFSRKRSVHFEGYQPVITHNRPSVFTPFYRGKKGFPSQMMKQQTIRSNTSRPHTKTDKPPVIVMILH